jgi:hypothetical protein
MPMPFPPRPPRGEESAPAQESGAEALTLAIYRQSYSMSTVFCFETLLPGPLLPATEARRTIVKTEGIAVQVAGPLPLEQV